MKAIVLLAVLLPLICVSQINITDKHQNTYKVIPLQDDTAFGLKKSGKMHLEPWKASGITLISADWASIFFILPSINLPSDKWYHLGAGFFIGAGSNYLAYRLTKKKWLSFAIGVGASAIIGGLKEFYDSKTGGVASWPDALTTVTGGTNGSLSVLIPIGHKEWAKR